MTCNSSFSHRYRDWTWFGISKTYFRYIYLLIWHMPKQVMKLRDRIFLLSREHCKIWSFRFWEYRTKLTPLSNYTLHWFVIENILFPVTATFVSSQLAKQMEWGRQSPYKLHLAERALKQLTTSVSTKAGIWINHRAQLWHEWSCHVQMIWVIMNVEKPTNLDISKQSFSHYCFHL